MNENYRQQVAQLFRALTNPARLAILELLREDEQCVCHLEARLKYRQAYISQQLAILREAGIVQDRREGWNIYYRITRPEVFDLFEAARVTLGLPSELKMVKEEAVVCPCPKCGDVVEKAM
ncbi:MAG: metalloregulator ArsR/SmtB family transcription factor [Chloroflexota bacterium]|nr:winged helix-turn-helix transcriptional regulator [Chloroflexota bacterium]